MDRVLEFSGTSRFVIKRQLGAGGMGVVYEALDKKRNARVALKTLKNVDAQALYRFKNEFRALQDLEHPNLVSLGELFEEEGQWFFTMELVDGTDFLTWIRGGLTFGLGDSDVSLKKKQETKPTPHQFLDTEVDSSGSPPLADRTREEKRPNRLNSPDETSGPPTVDDVSGPTLEDSGPPGGGREVRSRQAGAFYDEVRLREGLRQLATGLLALHDSGKVHRDIKPSNVRVTPGGRVVLLDFGLIVEAVDVQESSEGNIVGTVAYMAPEQAASKPVGPEADWYSVGVMLYEALTGTLPHTGSPLRVLMDKQQYEPRPPRRVIDRVPPDLDRLCAELLRFEPRARPRGPTVLRRLGAEEKIPPRSLLGTSLSSSRTAPFVGRAAEHGLLSTAFSATRQGKAVTVFVRGESGLGKSELIQRFGRGLSREAGVVVLAGRCYERESVPFKAFDGVVDSLSRYMKRLSNPEAEALVPRNAALLARVFPVLERVEAVAQAPAPVSEVRDPVELRARAFAALRELFYRLAERHPLILLIDDLQWADADSRLLLGDLMRPPDAPPLLLLISTREVPGAAIPTEVETRPLSGEARRKGRKKTVELVRRDETPEPATNGRGQTIPGDVREILLQPLAPEEAQELARLLLLQADETAEEAAQAIAAESGGHPLYIDALVRHLDLVGAERLPALRLDDAIRARVGELGERANLLLEMVCLAGEPLAQETVREATELEPTEFTRQLGVLRVSNLVRAGRRRETVQPYHDRVRESVLASLTVDRRALRHRRLAVALESSPAAREQPELLLRHLEAAGQLEKAARYGEQAAARASDALAFERSAELYRSTLRLGEHDPPTRRRLRMALAEALANAGRLVESANEYLAVAQGGADPPTRLECLRRAAEQFLITGYIPKGLSVLEDVRRDVGVPYPRTLSQALMSLLWQRAKLRLRGYEFRERHESEISPGDLKRWDVYRATAISLALVDHVRAQHFQTLGLLLALKMGERRRALRALLYEVGFLSPHGGRDLDRARRLLAEVGPRVEESGDTALVAYVHSGDGIIRYFSTEFRTAADKLQAAAKVLVEQTVGEWGELNIVRSIHLMALHRAGEYAELRRGFRQYILDAIRRGDRYTETTLTRLCNQLWLLDDDPGEARRQLDSKTWMPPEDTYHLQHYWEMVALADLALYDGSAPRRLEELRPRFAAYERSLLNRSIQMAKVESRWIWARLHLARADIGEEVDASVREAARCVRQMRREQTGYGDVWSSLLHAAVLARRQGPEAAIRALAHCIELAERHEMQHCLHMARLRRGQLVGGDEGAALTRQARTWFASQGVKNLDRLCTLLAPGFP